jgi:energy-coupling factor transporter ATP-binding protein EcfA2
MDQREFCLRIGNYRCFSREKPIEFRFGRGITAFVGTNNSGKSAILRFLHDVRPSIPFWAALSRPDHHLASFAEHIADRLELFHERNDDDIHVRVEWNVVSPTPCKLQRQWCEVRYLRSASKMEVRRINGFQSKDFTDSTAQGTRVYSKNRIRVLCDASDLTAAMEQLGKAMYIPAVRSTAPVPGGTVFDMLVGREFVEQWHSHRAGDVKENRERLKKVELDIARLAGLSEFRATRSAAGPTLLITMNGREHRLPDVGTGIGQLLMLLGSVAIRKPSIVLIDEPEANLHPSLQMDLITTLASYSEGNLVFATHNIGLARAVADRIYAVQQDRHGVSTVTQLEDHPSPAQLVGELQYGAYSQVGGAKVLLVEGPEDVRIFQQFLRKLRADHKVILIPLGGNTQINGSQKQNVADLLRICPDVAAVIDSEKSNKKGNIEQRRLHFQEMCSKVGIKCHILERRAIENYFTSHAIRAVCGLEHNELEPYDSPKVKWGKAIGWRIAEAMTLEEFLATDVGKFIDEWVRDEGPKKR